MSGTELQTAYAEMAERYTVRVQWLTRSGWLIGDKIGDRLGSVEEYLMDAAYCRAVAAGMPEPVAEAIAMAEVRVGWTRERPQATVVMRKDQTAAQSAPAPLPDPIDAIRELRAAPWMQQLTQREAEALILVEGCLMKPAAAAVIMRCAPSRVNNLLLQARRKFGASMGAAGNIKP